MKRTSGERGFSRARSPRHAALLTAMALLVTAACGQKAGVYVAGAPELPGGLGPSAGSTTYEIDPATGEAVPVAPATSAGTSATSAGAGAGAPADSVEPGVTDGARGDPAAATLSSPPEGGNPTGVTDDTIKIGLHLPMTGAAFVPPFAPESLKRYFAYMAAKGDLIAGRKVEVVWKNDEYLATTARSRCKEMVERDKVFMLVGYAGPHTIRACARYAASVGVPYVAPGSTEHYVAGLDTHFGLTMTYARQLPILADLMVDRLAARSRKNAIVRVETADPPERYDTPREALEARDVRVEVEHLMTTQADYSEIQTIVTDLKQRGIENVLFGGSPLHFTYFSQIAGKQAFRPRIIAGGPTIGYDIFLGGACNDGRVAHRTLALHITPAFIDRNRFDKEFDQATGPSGNEIDWMFWGLAKPIAELLRLSGRNLTRERFLWYAARAKNIATGVFPPISFSPEDHFGGESMHLLRANCDDTRWHTQKAFFKG